LALGFILIENPLTQEGELVQQKTHGTRWIDAAENTWNKKVNWCSGKHKKKR